MPTLQLSGPLRVTPAGRGVAYQRCGTLGGDTHWAPILSPDHRRLAVHTSAGTVRLIDLEHGVELAQLAAFDDSLSQPAFSPDGRLLATFSGGDHQIALWDARDGRLVRSFPEEGVSGEAAGGGVAFSLDGRYVLAADGTRLEVATGAVEQELIDAWPISMTVLAGGEYALSYSEYRSGSSNLSARIQMVRVGGRRERIELFAAWKTTLGGYAVSPDGGLVAVAGSAGDISLYAPGDVKRLLPPAMLGSAKGIAFSAGGARVVVRTADAVVVLAAGDLRELWRFSLDPKVEFLGLSPSGSVVGTDARTTTWWALETGGVQRTLEDRLSRIAWSKDGVLAVGVGEKELAYVLREADGAELFRGPARGTTPPLVDPAADRHGTPWNRRSSAPLAQSLDGRVEARLTFAFELPHGAGSFYRLQVLDTESRAVLRSFGPTNTYDEYGSRAYAALSGDGARLYTKIDSLASHHIAVWCR